MICFLTSRTDIKATGEANPVNGFIDELRRFAPNPCRVLHICSDPTTHGIMDAKAAEVRSSLERIGFVFTSYLVLDDRNEEHAEELIADADILILSGGHVPTQNSFFHKIALKELIKNYDGIIIGISAGSMNSAEVVYAQPEYEGEAVDPEYQRFLSGLGLTKTMLLPHYQDLKDEILDGMRLFEDITFADSIGRTFYAIPDGSYLFIDGEREELRGEAYMIRDGRMTKIASDGETVAL
ncbi:MAG: Type 1 glutamine amidotransferase-like domain-containing protein [Clostridia bacterium]|nr:Type 1 glutamine amidotransferase-like domain-containing protein [Clostridia bacterium]